jgi:hypothetical protein
MWDYGIPYDGHNRMRLSCKLCGMEMFGGIRNLKYHLAKILGNEVGIFPASTPEIVHIENQSIFVMGRREEFNLDLSNRSTSISGAGKC